MHYFPPNKMSSKAYSAPTKPEDLIWKKVYHDDYSTIYTSDRGDKWTCFHNTRKFEPKTVVNGVKVFDKSITPSTLGLSEKVKSVLTTGAFVLHDACYIVSGSSSKTQVELGEFIKDRNIFNLVKENWGWKVTSPDGRSMNAVEFIQKIKPHLKQLNMGEEKKEDGSFYYVHRVNDDKGSQDLPKIQDRWHETHDEARRMAKNINSKAAGPATRIFRAVDSGFLVVTKYEASGEMGEQSIFSSQEQAELEAHSRTESKASKGEYKVTEMLCESEIF